MTTLADQIQQMQSRCEKATPGPWFVWSQEGPDGKGVEKYSVCQHGEADGEHGDECVATAYGKTDAKSEANATFIAAARTDLPRLLAWARQAQAALECYDLLIRTPLTKDASHEAVVAYVAHVETAKLRILAALAPLPSEEA